MGGTCVWRYPVKGSALSGILNRNAAFGLSSIRTRVVALSRSTLQPERSFGRNYPGSSP
jgi:hypothetical protein